MTHSNHVERKVGLRRLGVAVAAFAALAFLLPSDALADRDRDRGRDHRARHHDTDRGKHRKKVAKRDHRDRRYGAERDRRDDRRYRDDHRSRDRHYRSDRYRDDHRSRDRHYRSDRDRDRHYRSDRYRDHRYKYKKHRYDRHDRYDRYDRYRSHAHRYRFDPFRVPLRLHRHLRHELLDFFFGSVYDRHHRHHHDVYRYPVYVGDRLYYRDYPYCDGRLYRDGIGGYFDYHGRRVHIGINF